MLKSILLALLFAFILATAARAQDDRYFDSRRVLTQKPSKSHARHVRHSRTIHARRHHRAASRPFRHGKTLWRGAADELKRAVTLGSRPAGCPARAWCGCWLARHLGIARRDLWLARNWAGVGKPTSAVPGAIVVWRHHVGKVTGVRPGAIRLLSGNDGNRVRERWRSTRGVIAYRML